MNKPSLRERAMNLLAHREHSHYELIHKLTDKGFDHDEVIATVERLKDQGLQSDDRFSENYVRYRINRGFGSQKIRQELQQRGITKEQIDDTLNKNDIDWFALAHAAKVKKFGEQAPTDYKQRAKQQRFLQSRGFTLEQIQASFTTE